MGEKSPSRNQEPAGKTFPRAKPIRPRCASVRRFLQGYKKVALTSEGFWSLTPTLYLLNHLLAVKDFSRNPANEKGRPGLIAAHAFSALATASANGANPA